MDFIRGGGVPVDREVEKGEFVNWFNRNKKETTKKSDVNEREQYAEDFKGYMENSLLEFFQQDGKDNELIYIGYLIRTPPAGIWLYALVGFDMIAAGLRILSPRHIEILKKQEEDIQVYFDEELEWRHNGVGITQYGKNLMDIGDRDEQFYFLRKTLETLDVVFRHRVAQLDSPATKDR